MTGRGKASLRPPSPPDPTLRTRPVPRKHRFPTCSFAPGAAPDIQQTVTSAKALSRAAQDDAASQTLETRQVDCDRKFLRHIESENDIDYWQDNRPTEPDPTWGFFLFLTDYASTTTANVPRAIENLLKVQQQQMSTSPRWANPYSKELYHRLKFDLVEDQEALQRASVDRVRECFRAHVKGLGICTEDDHPGPVRYKVCLVLDRSAVEMLADLTFPDDDDHDRLQDLSRDYRQCKLRAVDLFWRRPELAENAYRGAKDLEIDYLRYNYDLMDTLDLESAD